MPHRRSRYHLRCNRLKKTWKNERRNGATTDRQDCKVEDPKDIPKGERFARGERLVSGKRKHDPGSGDTDHHIANSCWPGEVTRQKAKHVESDEAKASESPRLRCCEQRYIRSQHEVVKRARCPVDRKKYANWNDDRSKQGKWRRTWTIQESSACAECET